MQISRLCLFSKRRIASASFILRQAQDIRSFTLVELLIVIGILAVLTAAVVVVMNPTERLREARDSTRIQELSSLEKTIQLLITQNSDIALGIANTVYVSIADNASTTCGSVGLPALPAGYVYNCVTQANLRKTDGTGWIPINFSSSGITTLTSLPIDPINTTSTGLYYTYMMGGSFELNSVLESQKHRNVASKDGGDSFSMFEKGSNKTLTPYSDSGLVGYWTFDEGSGTTAADSSGNGNTGTLTNGPIRKSGSDCKVGGCLNFETYDKYVGVPDTSILNFGTGAFSVLFYAKSAAVPGMVSAFISKGSRFDGNIAGWSIQLTSTPIRPYLIISSNSARREYNTEKIDMATWAQFGMIRDNSGNFYFVYNGNKNLISGGPYSYDVSNSSYDLLIGKSNYYTSGHLHGDIDDVRIYNRTLSAAEIQAIYNATR